VEKTYASDEALLFPGKIKYTVHSKPINVSLLLYDRTKKRNYLEEAYLFDQRNKASTLAFNVRENELKNETGNANQRTGQEISLKTSITRLSLKAAQATDSAALSQIHTAIRDNEIKLGKLQEELNEDPGWLEKKTPERIPPVKQIQKLLDNTTALLSYHLSENELLILLITPGRFEYHKSPVNQSFFTSIESLRNALHNTSASQRYTGINASARLYERLIDPVQSKLSQIKRLIIIPDDELSYLPFEVLQDKNKKYLVERFSIQYQYSTALLGKHEKLKLPPGTLSFAPFASNGYKDSSGALFSVLPASKEEIIQLKGIAFTDKDATKSNFLHSVNRYGTIHLATHASVNNEEPSRSFITFFPGNDDYKLYAREIGDLRLDSTQLVILSACETGAGQLIKGEGLMSLSRAFASAGCPNIITSLWKAEDKTTAFLTQQLHYYLDKNYTTDKALQQARMDLLKSEDIDPRFKSPNYWGHLIFIGDYEPRHNSSNWWWIAITFITGAIIYIVISRKSK
ncbi:MAG: CHAT domain-containing protein, partial [Ferruginibacter sp.]|nr:CHAT domain-containing protein [Chitinophagaceae bacterium]